MLPLLVASLRLQLSFNNLRRMDWQMVGFLVEEAGLLQATNYVALDRLMQSGDNGLSVILQRSCARWDEQALLAVQQFCSQVPERLPRWLSPHCIQELHTSGRVPLRLLADTLDYRLIYPKPEGGFNLHALSALERKLQQNPITAPTLWAQYAHVEDIWDSIVLLHQQEILRHPTIIQVGMLELVTRAPSLHRIPSLLAWLAAQDRETCPACQAHAAYGFLLLATLHPRPAKSPSPALICLKDQITEGRLVDLLAWAIQAWDSRASLHPSPCESAPLALPVEIVADPAGDPILLKIVMVTAVSCTMERSQMGKQLVALLQTLLLAWSSHQLADFFAHLQALPGSEPWLLRLLSNRHLQQRLLSVPPHRSAPLLRVHGAARRYHLRWIVRYGSRSAWRNWQSPRDIWELARVPRRRFEWNRVPPPYLLDHQPTPQVLSQLVRLLIETEESNLALTGRLLTRKDQNLPLTATDVKACFFALLLRLHYGDEGQASEGPWLLPRLATDVVKQLEIQSSRGGAQVGTIDPLLLSIVHPPR